MRPVIEKQSFLMILKKIENNILRLALFYLIFNALNQLYLISFWKYDKRRISSKSSIL
jgi:hypothetical protein